MLETFTDHREKKGAVAVVELNNQKVANGEKLESEVLDCPEGYGAARIVRTYQASLGLFLLIGADCEMRRSLERGGVSCRLSCGLETK